MASASISGPQERARPSPWARLMPTLALALPFLTVGYVANSRLFMSDEHARLLSNALIVVDRGRAELIGYVYPPLPFFLLLPWPCTIALVAVAALSGGALTRALWGRLSALPVPTFARMALLVAVMAAPTSLYLATQSLVETLALLLLVISWSNYLAFVQEGETRAGFAAGLALGTALFVSQYTLLYATVYILLTPTLITTRGSGSEVSATLVLLFPVAVSIGAWSYISWAFTGDPLYFLRAPGSSLLVYARPNTTELSLGWPLALRSTLRDLMASPLYLGVGLVVAILWPIRLPVFLVPVALITAARAYGLVYPDYFAISTYAVTALIALRPGIPQRFWPALLAAAIIHLTAGYLVPLQGEMAEWGRAMRTGQITASSLEEQEVGRQLAGMPARSVLLDDRIAYRIVARAETSKPFLLPVDGLYRLAESQPSLFVSYVLAPAEPIPSVGGHVASSYPTKAPRNFSLEGSWTGWRLYHGQRQQASDSLLIAKPSGTELPAWQSALQRIAQLLTWFISS